MLPSLSQSKSCNLPPRSDAHALGSITTKYPDLDCVFLNAGFYQHYDFSKPDTVDIEAFHSEIRVNFTAYVNVTLGFLPFFLKKQTPAGIIL